MFDASALRRVVETVPLGFSLMLLWVGSTSQDHCSKLASSRRLELFDRSKVPIDLIFPSNGEQLLEVKEDRVALVAASE